MLKKFLKWILRILLGLFLIILAAVIILPMVIDPNDYKDEIIAQVKKETGRDLAIPGNIELSIFPWLGFDIGEVQLKNPEGFNRDSFVSIEHARAHVRLFSLFSEKIDIRELELDGLKINLLVNRAGKDNWSDLMSRTAGEDKQTREEATTASSSAVFSIQSLSINNAELNYLNQQTQKKLALKNIQIESYNIDTTGRFPLSVTFTGQLDKSLQGKFKLDTDIDLSTPDSLLLHDLEINSSMHGADLPQGKLDLKTKIPKLSFDAKQQHLDITSLFITLNDIHVQGHAELKNFSSPVIRFALDINKLDLDRLLGEPEQETKPADSKANQDAKPLQALEPVADMDIEGKINLAEFRFKKLEAKNIQLDVLSRKGLITIKPDAEFYDGKIHGDINIRPGQSSPRIKAKMDIRNVSLAPLMLALTDGQAISGIALASLDITTSGELIDTWIKNLNGNVNFRLSQTSARSVDLEDWFLSGLKKYLPKKSNPEKRVTLFDEVRGSLQIKNGVIHNNDLLATSRQWHVRGKGQTSLVDHSINYTATVIAQTPRVLTINGKDYDFKGRPIPTRFYGTWDKLKIGYGFDDVIKGMIIQAQKKRIEKKKQKIEQKIDKEIEKKVDKLKQKLGIP
jgi:AsmA protein